MNLKVFNVIQKKIGATSAVQSRQRQLIKAVTLK